MTDLTGTMFKAAQTVYGRILPEWGWRRWASVGIGALLISLIPRALADADWLELNSVLWRASILGALVGWLLGRLSRRALESRILATITLSLLIGLGAGFSAGVHSRVLPPLNVAIREIAQMIGWGVGEAWGSVSDDEHTAVPQPEMAEWESGAARWSLYWLNLQAEWPPLVEPDHWESGQLLLSSLLAALVWALVGFAMWLLARGESAWAALIPLGALLALNVYYTGGGWSYPILAMVLALALHGEITLRTLERRWSKGSVYTWLAQEWWMWLTLFGALTLVVMVITLGVTDPKFHEWVDSLWKPEEVAEGGSGGAQRQPRDQGPPPGIWPRDHLLQSSIDLSQQPAMTVLTPGSPPAQFYWRAASYDHYTGHGWLRTTRRSGSDQQAQLFPQSTDPPAGYALMRQEFIFEFTTRQVYAAGRPVRLSFPAEGEWSDSAATDLVSVHTLTETRAYQVLSWVPAFGEAALRDASSADYPDLIAERYLQLPDELPSRIRQRAAQITSGQQTPYDRALALQAYLREYEYTLDLPTPPPDADVVDAFLFEWQRGYCDYYASAMVIMARSVGIPARLVIGYRMGDYDAEAQAYRVTMADAHSWPELYFVGIGWIAFEPTAAYPTLNRDLPPDWGAFAPATVNQDPRWIEPPAPDALDWREFWPVLAGMGALLLIGLIVWARDAFHEWRRRRLAPDALIASLYVDAVRSGRRLGVIGDDSQTPYEFRTALIDELALRSRYLPAWMGDWEARSMPIQEAARALIGLYADERYSPRHADQAAADRALAAWPAIKWGLLRFRFASWLRRLVFGELPREWITAPEPSGD